MPSVRTHLRSAALWSILAALSASETPVEFHGFIGQGYVVTSANAYYTPETRQGGSLDFREIGLNVSARPEERLRLGMQIISQDMGRLYNNEIAIDWASAVYTVPLRDWEIDAKVGRIRTGHALYNDCRDLDLSRTSVFLPESVYYNSWRRLYIAVDGAGCEVRSPSTAVGSFKLGLTYGTQQIPVDDPMLEVYGETVGVSRMRRQWGAQLSWLPTEGLLFKQSFMSLEDWRTDFAAADPTVPDTLLSDDSPYYHEWVTSVEYVRGTLVCALEGSYWLSRGQSVYRGAAPTDTYAVDWKQRGFGAYAAASWEFAPDWKAGVMVQSLDFLDDTSGVASTSRSQALGFSAAWSVTPHWLLKAEGQRVRGNVWLRDADQPTAGEYDSRYWNLFAVKTAFDF